MSLMDIIDKVKNYQNSLKTKKHIKAFFGNYTKKESNGKRILIYAGIGHMYISYFEILLYHLLIKEGYKVDYLIYDENIPINELITKSVIETKGKEVFWNKEVLKSKKLLKDVHIDFEHINASRKEVKSEVESVADSLQNIYAFKKDGIALGEIVKGTMFRYYKSLTFDADAFEVAKKFLFTTLTNYYEIKQRTHIKKYDYVLFSHGIYVTWEPVVEFCKTNHINFIVYDRAKTKNTININFNQVAPDWSFDTAWDRYINKSLNDQEKEQVRNYLKDRELQTNDVYAYNFSKRSENITGLKTELKIPLDSKVITIFTNLIWDAANVARDLAFKNAFQCLIETIEYYKHNKQVHIILRAHPAEKVLGTKERYGDLLRAHFNSELPSNVTIIEPEMAINSFSVIDISDVGVVNTSTVGLEFAMLGKPIILISETHYRNKGFTYDVITKDEYFNRLNNLIETAILKPNQEELAKKYFYLMMFKYQQKIPLEYENGVFKNYLYKSIDKIPLDNNIYTIIAKINDEMKDDFINWN